MASIGSRRKLFFILLNIGLLTRTLSRPMEEDSRPETRRKSLVSSMKNSGIDQVGNPEDLAWQAWLLVDQGGGNIGGGLDSASLLRKITPKSIFIAPSLQALPACAEGYQADPMNRCVKNVNINHEAHLDFLVQRLNAMYANLGGTKPEAAASSSDSVPTGPLQLDLLNIPVAASPEDQEEDQEEDFDDESQALSIPSSEVKPLDRDEGAKVTVDEKAEEHEDESDEKTFFHEAPTTKDGIGNNKSNSTKYDGIVSIVAFVDDTNSSYSEVVGYKVEPDEKIHNHTIAEEVTDSQSDDDKREEFKEKWPLNNSSVSPTVVLLLTPTKLPVSKLDVQKDDKLNPEVEEIFGVNFSERLPTTTTPFEILFNESAVVDPEMNTSKPQLLDIKELAEETETELPGQHEDVEDIEESSNDDEILTHSEASMIVTAQPRIQLLSIPVDNNNDTTSSKISSSTSINDDFVRETIVVGVNIHENANATNSLKLEETTSLKSLTDENLMTVTPALLTDQETTFLDEDSSSYTEYPENAEITEDDTDGKKESTTMENVGTKQEALPAITKVRDESSTSQKEMSSVIRIEELRVNENIHEISSTRVPLIDIHHNPNKSDNSEIMTASSSNNAEAIVSQYPSDNPQYSPSSNYNNRKRVDPHSTEFPSRDESKYVTLITPDNSDVFTEIKTIEDQMDLQKVSDADSFFPNHQNLGLGNVPNDFVRFPNYNRIQNGPSYVRFPSEGVNSIHSYENFKGNHHHQTYSNQGTVNNLSSPQKQVHWRDWRNDRQGSIRPRFGVNEKQKDRAPIWFWTRMPLVRDPSLLHYPVSGTFESSDKRSHENRRFNYFKPTSRDVSRPFVTNTPVEG